MAKSQKVDLNEIDLDKLKDQSTENPGTIAFPHNVGSALVKPEDMGKTKGKAVAAMKEQTNIQLKQLYEQMQTLVKQANSIKKRVEVSERIYMAQMNFEPVIGYEYYLYEKKNQLDVLSMISPDEWGSDLPFNKLISKVRLLSDHTWEVLK